MSSTTQMLPRRVLAARPLTKALTPTLINRSFSVTSRLRDAVDPENVDPGQNGGYINPPAQKRILRDPHADWWDKQERRNYGEPVHEDNDTLGLFTTEVYNWTTPGHGIKLQAAFVVTLFALLGAVYVTAPGKPSVPRTFPGGLQKELGGPGTVGALPDGTEFTTDNELV
ncbi:NADH:ubiquinone oxidoreductase 20.1kD subunit [Venturia nashicola]|uniref:NADH:ubiquinone oxidoreductase 20.1kD subunit n=1 Tax=Venturia nashicola TaxID=86259 RepID=A0A4Z1PKF5_9PEZI|nr:NADH:ubiquinone oxidoreductase 20.1kD subunit [Venturia nashicola]TLD38415.1 NADH:ubiquinone oxidoreductase 20.1kD subunit [Venturia nashicola]